MRSERGLSTILHCPQWYKLVMRTRLSTAAVQYPILQPFAKLRCHLAGTLVRSNEKFCLMGSLTTQGKRKFVDLWVESPPSQNLRLPTCESLADSTDQRFRVVPNCFGHLLLLSYFRSSVSAIRVEIFQSAHFIASLCPYDSNPV